MDATDEEDLEIAALGLGLAWADGLDVVARTAPPLAAVLAGRRARSFVAPTTGKRRILVVAGSYVPLTTLQLAELEERHPGSLVETDVARLLEDPVREGRRLASEVESRFEGAPVAVVATPRIAPSASLVADGLGERVARGLAGVLDELDGPVDVLVGKGGVTSAVLARHGLHWASAWVVGPPRRGLSWWQVPSGDRTESVSAPGEGPWDRTVRAPGVDAGPRANGGAAGSGATSVGAPVAGTAGADRSAPPAHVTDLVVFAGNVGDASTLGDLVDHMALQP